jgi:hypothetical protein
MRTLHIYTTYTAGNRTRNITGRQNLKLHDIIIIIIIIISLHKQQLIELF